MREGRKDILHIITSRDYAGLENELTTTKTNQKYLDETLRQTTLQGDAKSVEMLIKFGANPNHVYDNGDSLLHFAMRGGKEDVIAELIRQGVLFRDWEYEGVGFTKSCIERGFLVIVQLLLKQGDLELDEEDDSGRTPLHLACLFGQLKIVGYLLELAPASINVRDDSGWTPLHYACSEAGRSFKQILQVLFGKKADPLLLTNNNKTSLDLAYESGRAQDLIDVLTVQKMVQLLISVDNVITGNSTSISGGFVCGGGIGALLNQSHLSDPSTGENVTLPAPPFSAGSGQTTAATNKHGLSGAVVTKISLWRKVLLNDDVESLEEYRDSGVWYDPENPQSFEDCQNLTQDVLCELFRSSFENGMGVFSYFNTRYRYSINSRDLHGILVNISGIERFCSLSAENCVLFSSLHCSALFIAFISGRFKVVELLLQMRQFDIIPACLLICLIVQTLKASKDLPGEITENLKTMADKAEGIASDALNRVFMIDNSPEKEVTLRFLSTEMSCYGGKSLIDVADAACCSNFLALPCCQLILDRRWYGNLRPLRSPLKWIIRFAPIFILCFNPYNDRSGRAIFLNSRPKSRFSDADDIQCLVRNKNSVQLANTDPHSASFVDSSDTEKNTNSLSRLQVLYAVVNAPGTKFFYHSVAHILFIIAMTYVVLFNFQRNFNLWEILCYAFVAGYAVEELVQCVQISRQSSILNYISDLWNALDLLAIFLIGLGFTYRVMTIFSDIKFLSAYEESMSTNLYISRLLLINGLLFFYVRMLSFLTIFESLGPKLRMIFEMFKKDLFPMLLLFFTLVIAFAVIFQGMLYPNGWLYTVNAAMPPKKVQSSKWLSVLMMMRRAIYGIFEVDYAMDEFKCEGRNYCGHPIGISFFNNIYCVVYIGIVVIMLMNLLIALFSNTVARINERSMEHWLAGRYKLVEEYKERSVFPPPFNIVERLSDTLCMARSLLGSGSGDGACIRLSQGQTGESELNVVVKFVISQTFALKTSRFILGSRESRDILSKDDKKRSGLDLRILREQTRKMDKKLGRVLAMLSQLATAGAGCGVGGGGGLRRSSFFRPAHLSSRRNSRVSDSGGMIAGNTVLRTRDQEHSAAVTPATTVVMEELTVPLDTFTAVQDSSTTTVVAGRL